MMKEQFEVWLPVVAAYNAGEWRVSKQVTGPRGGKKWVRVTRGIPATGGMQQMFLTPGRYKINYWTNNMPRKACEFVITEDGEYVEVEGE